MKQELCRLDEVPETGSIVREFFGREIHIYRANGRIRAIANACLHIGGPLACHDGEFVCAWHGARFAMVDGNRIDGPAPKNSRLMTIPTREDAGSLFYVWQE